MVLVTRQHALQQGRVSPVPSHFILRNYMEKLIVEAQAEIPPTAKLVNGLLRSTNAPIFAAPGGPEPGAALPHAP